MEITHPVREYAAKGMAEMSEKFEAEGFELYSEDYVGKEAQEAGSEAKPAAE